MRLQASFLRDRLRVKDPDRQRARQILKEAIRFPNLYATGNEPTTNQESDGSS